MVLKTDEIKVFENNINLIYFIHNKFRGGKGVRKNIFAKSIKILKK